jgi:hypothetical protein
MISASRLVAAALFAVSPMAAQTGLQLTAGVTSSGALVNDGVLHTKLQAAIAPTFGIGIALPTGKGPYRVRLEARVSSAALNANTDGASDKVMTLTSITTLVMAEGPLTGEVRWQVGGGALFYRPSESQGVFLDGPARRWLIAGGAVFSHELTPKIRLLVSGLVDAHSFVTNVLTNRNYAGSQGVERYTLSVGVERKL